MRVHQGTSGCMRVPNCAGRYKRVPEGADGYQEGGGGGGRV